MSVCFRRKLSRGVFFACAVSALTLWTTPGRAVPLSFVLTGPDSASWVLDSNPQPESYITGQGFSLSGGPAAFLIFWSDTATPPGGFTATDDNGGVVLDFTGLSLYTGTEAAPVFRTGTFTFFGNPDGVDTLTISATPLPPAWILFLTTIAGLFGWRRSRMSPA